jgi:SAM-dependent methyltransferase
MSEQDRDKWNRRYRDGAYAERAHPSAFLAEWLPRLRERWPPLAGRVPRALDLACGAGRNAIWLAEQGFAVDALDVSDAALDVARERAAQRGVDVGWHRHDLDAGVPDRFDGYDLIVVMRFLDRALFPRLPQRLRSWRLAALRGSPADRRRRDRSGRCCVPCGARRTGDLVPGACGRGGAGRVVRRSRRPARGACARRGPARRMTDPPAGACAAPTRCRCADASCRGAVVPGRSPARR